MADPRFAKFEISLYNQFLAGSSNSQIKSVDLHGLSVQDAKRTIQHTLCDAVERGVETIDRIRFITGRGNHANTTGERGTLYQHFEEYLNDVKDKVFKIYKYDGYYEVDIRNVIRHTEHQTVTEQAKKYLQENIEHIKAGALLGKKENLAMLAVCYQHGLGVAQNYQEMTKIYQQLADAGDVLSQYELACSFFIGRGVRLNDEKARYYYQLAADQNYALAELSLGNIYLRGIGVPRDHQLAYPLLRKAALHGQGEAARKVGCFHAEGWSTDGKIDYPEAIKWWKLGVKLNDATSAYNLYLTYITGVEKTGTEPIAADASLAYHYLESSAKLGDQDGEYVYGIALHKGQYGEKRKNESLFWIKKAADHRSADALFFLYLHTLQGKSFTTQDIETAKMYLKKAAEAGHIVAQLHIVVEFNFHFSEEVEKNIERLLLEQDENRILSITNHDIKFKVLHFLLRNENPKKAIKKALSILRKLADANDLEAIRTLWTTFLRDKNNPTEALKYLLRGEKLEDTDSLCALGYFWQDGANGKMDDEKAYLFFKRAATKNNANSHNQLGQFYEKGRWVKQDRQEAEKHYREAMRIDDPKSRTEDTLNAYKFAALNLGAMLLKDPARQVEAVKLLELSMEDGHEDAALFLAFHYHYLKMTDYFLYYLSKAYMMGNKQSQPIVQRLIEQTNFDPKEYLKAFAQAPLATSTTPTTLAESAIPTALISSTQSPLIPNSVFALTLDKTNVYEQLAKLNDIFHEKLDWKIAKGTSAWAYISTSLKEQLEVLDINLVKKTKDGKFILVIEKIFELNFYRFVEKLSPHFLLAAETKNRKSQ